MSIRPYYVLHPLQTAQNDSTYCSPKFSQSSHPPKANFAVKINAHINISLTASKLPIYLLMAK